MTAKKILWYRRLLSAPVLMMFALVAGTAMAVLVSFIVK